MQVSSLLMVVVTTTIGFTTDGKKPSLKDIGDLVHENPWSLPLFLKNKCEPKSVIPSNHVISILSGGKNQMYIGVGQETTTT